MNLIQRLQKSFNDDDEIDYSYWANKSVKEIMKNIKSNKEFVVLNNDITKNKKEILEKEATNEKSPIYNKIVKEVKQQFIDTIRNENPNIINTKYTKQKSNKPEKHSSKNMKAKGNNKKRR
jgi:small-conductance mechanosensitive channel